MKRATCGRSPLQLAAILKASKLGCSDSASWSNPLSVGLHMQVYQTLWRSGAPAPALAFEAQSAACAAVTAEIMKRNETNCASNGSVRRHARPVVI